jgi:NitT/TauT family transport system permease protein
MSTAVATPAQSRVQIVRPAPPRTKLSTLAAIPFATAIGAGVHAWAGQGEPIPAPEYFTFLGIVFGLSVIGAIAQQFSTAIRAWAQNTFPIIALGIILLAVWETVTAGLHLLPLPYFPGPGGVLKNLIDDRALIFDSTWHSLLLLLSGYALGVMIALVTGVCIGWFSWARYWGMPFLKILGPIPATAWVPLAMVISPSSMFSAVGLIALAVWFPVTMLTISGIANTKASYLDVARTLGASESYLIFRVAIPAAMPNIFIGLFMGLGTSFLTLIVAETVGVKSGLGWYLAWAQGWAEYGKVYAALVIMAAFFSTIMTCLFKVRDRVLDWQKGVIKW